jgi:hypothetical protein
MTADTAEQHRAAEAAKAAWVAGFEAARHNPNHPLPDLTVRWEGSTPHVEPNWRRRMPGYIG